MLGRVIKSKDMCNQPPDIKAIQTALTEAANPETAKFLQKYFKTGPGEYGEGDRFRGIKVPVIRKIARRAADMPLNDLRLLLKSPWHEDRLLALLVMADRFAKTDENVREQIYQVYLNESGYINNWDLVDLSAPAILGGYLWHRERKILFDMARSANLWKRRMSVMATFYFIRNSDFRDSIAIAKILLQDPGDLIQKAVGWMLREIGKRDLETEETFLKAHYPNMPRTMLRYAIERFPEPKRQAYLKGNV